MFLEENNSSSSAGGNNPQSGDVQEGNEETRIKSDENVARPGELIGVEGTTMKDSLSDQDKLAQMEAIIARNKQAIGGSPVNPSLEQEPSDDEHLGRFASKDDSPSEENIAEDTDLGLDFSLVEDEVGEELSKNFSSENEAENAQMELGKENTGVAEGDVPVFREFNSQKQQGKVLDLSEQLSGGQGGVINELEANQDVQTAQEAKPLESSEGIVATVSEKFSIKEGVTEKEEAEAMSRLRQNIEAVDLEGNELVLKSVEEELGGEVSSEALPEKNAQFDLSPEDEKVLTDILAKAKERGPVFALNLAERLNNNFMLDKIRDTLSDNREEYVVKKEEKVSKNELSKTADQAEKKSEASGKILVKGE